jgi:NADH dehydrogenase
VLHHHQNVTFHQGVVTSIDTTAKEVTMDSMAPLKYDYLVLALGAVVNFFQTPGADQYAFPLYTMDDAIRLKEQVLKTFEAVDKNPSLIDDGALNFCVVGGGSTGVEVSGALAELLHAEMNQDYPNLPVDSAQVLLYEGAPHLLGPFKPELQKYALKALEERGVKVHTGTGVRKVAPASIELANGETVKTHTLIWAAGLKANPIVQSLGVELGHGGRIPVDPDLQVKNHPGVFAIGDIATMTDGETGKPLPGLGATALQALFAVLTGSITSLPIIWAVADVAMGVMTLLNVTTIVLLSPWAIAVLADYERSLAAGRQPVFVASNTPGLPAVPRDIVW